MAGLTCAGILEYQQFTRGWMTQKQDFSSKCGGFFDGMGDRDQRQVLLGAQFKGQVLQIFAGGGIQRGKGFIHQQQIGLQRQGTGNRRPLALAA